MEVQDTVQETRRVYRTVYSTVPFANGIKDTYSRLLLLRHTVKLIFSPLNIFFFISSTFATFAKLRSSAMTDSSIRFFEKSKRRSFPSSFSFKLNLSNRAGSAWNASRIDDCPTVFARSLNFAHSAVFVIDILALKTFSWSVAGNDHMPIKVQGILRESYVRSSLEIARNCSIESNLQLFEQL